MKLLIDQGNSRLKYCRWNSQNYLKPGVVETSHLMTSEDSFDDIEEVWVSSVRNSQEHLKLRNQLEKLAVPIRFASTQQQTAGLINSYDDISTMGVDRWLAMLAIWRDVQNEFVLIDAGTALTFDYVESDGSHQGGHILPGLELMRDALVSKTDRIRVTNTFSTNRTLANNTSEAVLHGCMASMSAYLEMMLNSLPESIREAIFITGGDAELLQESMHFDSHLRHDLVFRGLVEYFKSRD